MFYTKKLCFTYKKDYDIFVDIKNQDISNNPHQSYYSLSYSGSDALKKNEEGLVITLSGLKEIKFSPKKRVLDVACGIGLLGKKFSNNVYGFDINQQAVKMAIKNKIRAKIGDVEKKWVYPDNYFDIVIASHIIEHVVDPDKLILESKRVLKKGGLLILVTPNLACWPNRLLLLLGVQPLFTEVSTIDKTLGQKFLKIFAVTKSPVGHLRIFTLNSLREIIELHGFKIVKTTGVEFGSFPPIIRLLDRFISKIVPLAPSIILISKK